MNIDAVTSDEVLDQNQKNIPDVGIPLTLREFGEVPKGFVPVYIMIDKSSLEHVAKNGLRVEDNRMNEKKGDVEKVMAEVAQEMGIKGVDRTKSVFAFPRHPNKIRLGLSYYPERQFLIEALVDPNSKNTVVAEGSLYTDVETHFYEEGGNIAKDTAELYWESIKPLADYLKEDHTGKDDDYDDFEFPEILIPESIPTNRLRIIS